jgi:integrase
MVARSKFPLGPRACPAVPLLRRHLVENEKITLADWAAFKPLAWPLIRFHDLRATHETLLLDTGVRVHVVAARCGHAVLLRVYAKRTRKADTWAAVYHALSVVYGHVRL